MTHAVSYKCVNKGILDLATERPGELSYQEIRRMVPHDSKQQFDRQFFLAAIEIDGKVFPKTNVFIQIKETIRLLRSQLQDAEHKIENARVLFPN